MGISALVGTAIASGLADAGVGAATAGAIGGVAAPMLTNAALGAGASALFGGNIGQGALMGGVLGGLGELSPGGALSNMINGGGGSQMGPISVTGQHGDVSNVPINTTGPGGSVVPYGSTLAPGGALTQNASRIASGLTPTSQTLANLMAIGQYAARPQPQQPNAGPYFNKPLQTSGYLSQTRTPGYAPATGNWQTWGQAPEQPFYSSNQITGFSHGGALGRVFDTDHGEHFVRGGGSGQEDNINAKLSPGEFVWDASTVARVGDGNSEEGARRLEAARKAIADDAGSSRVVQKKVRSPLSYVDEARRTRGGSRAR